MHKATEINFVVSRAVDTKEAFIIYCIVWPYSSLIFAFMIIPGAAPLVFSKLYVLRLLTQRVDVIINRHFKTRQLTEVCREGARSSVKNKSSLKQNSFQHQSEASKCQIGVA